MKKLAIEQIVKAVNGELLQGDLKAEINGVSTDSRKISEEEAFFPLIGEQHDAHDFIPQALERGCRTIVLSKRPEADLLQKKDRSGRSILMVSSLAWGLALSLSGAEPEAKAAVKAAADQLAAQPNYSWTATTKLEGLNWRMGPVDGQTEKEGFTYVKMVLGDNTIETAFRGKKSAIKRNIITHNGAYFIFVFDYFFCFGHCYFLE